MGEIVVDVSVVGADFTQYVYVLGRGKPVSVKPFANVKMINDKFEIMVAPMADKYALESVGWREVAKETCEACNGKGRDEKDEPCWYCDGEGIDPLFGDD